MTSGIYTVTNYSDGKVYVGSSNHIERRWKEHKKQLRKGTHHSKHLQHAWTKYGEMAFTFEVLEECEQVHLTGAELFWINTLQTAMDMFGYNMVAVPNSTYGYRHTEETRKIFRELARNRVYSEETRRKISEAGKGRRQSQETIEKRRLKQLGSALSQESRKRISSSRGGRSFTVTCPNGNTFTFDTLTQAKEVLGLDQSNVHKCLIGKAKATRGHYCKYVDP